MNFRSNFDKRLKFQKTSATFFSRTNRLNCTNTLSKFFDNEEENVKKLNYFDPDAKSADINLYQMKIVKKDDPKKQEQSKSMDKLKQCLL